MSEVPLYRLRGVMQAGASQARLGGRAYPGWVQVNPQPYTFNPKPREVQVNLQP